jgi:DNA-binding LytR/AlgR family response regulator
MNASITSSVAPSTLPPRPWALIAEDEPLLAAHLRAELARHWPELHIAAQVGDGASALRQALALQPDLCWLDIRMPGMTGLEAAQALVEDWPEPGAGTGPQEGARPLPLLVFVTAYDQYALQAFEAQAVDYLVKPVQTERLVATISRLKLRLAERGAPALMSATPGAASPAANASTANAHRAAPPSIPPEQEAWLAQLRGLLASAPGLLGPQHGHPAAHPGHAATPSNPGDLSSSPNGALVVPSPASPAAPRLDIIQASAGNTVHLVPVAEVLYFEAADKYLRVITAEREHLIRLSLRDLLPQLDPQQFWQVHRSLVVRASAIHTAVKEDSGKVTLHLRGRPEKLTASRLYAHLFKGL